MTRLHRTETQTIHRWKIERRVPVTVLGTLGLQLFFLIAWATHLEARVVTLERRDAELAPLAGGVARLEERMEAMRQDVTHMRGQMDRVGDYLLKNR